MSDRYDEPASPGGSGAGGGGGADHELPSSPAPSGWLRGVGVVVVAVVIGVLLLPSATRAPLDVTTASQSTPTSTSPPTTAANSTTTTVATIVPGASSIHVLVANGTSITALAAGTSTYLRSRGFSTLTPTNATAKVTATRVYAVSVPPASATTVLSALGLPSSAVQPAGAVAPVPSTAGASVVVIAGPDLARLAPPTPTGPTPG
jgi:hypothetical protein